MPVRPMATVGECIAKPAGRGTVTTECRSDNCDVVTNNLDIGIESDHVVLLVRILSSLVIS